MKKQLLAISLLAATVSLKAQNPYPVIPIDTVQYVNPNKLSATPVEDRPDYIFPTMQNSTFADTVRFEGIVVTNPRIYGLSTSRKASYIQKPGGGPWSGVLVMCEPSGSGLNLANLISETKFYENMVPGYKVLVTGKFAAFDNETQMNLIRNNNSNWSNEIVQTSLDVTPPVATVITVDSVMTGNSNTTQVQQKQTGEKWEGVFVELRNVTVFSRQQSGTRWFWSVIDDNGNQLDIRDAFAYFRNDDNEDTIPKIENSFQPPVIGSRLSYIRGIITEYRTGTGQPLRYGLAPFSPGDIGPCIICPPAISNVTRTPIVATFQDSVMISTRVVAGTNTLDSVILNYAVGSTNNVYQKIQMTTIGNDVFTAKIPNQTAGSIVKYWIKAKDVQGIALNVPDTIGLTSAYLVIDSTINNIRQLQVSAQTNRTTIWNGDVLTNMDVKGVVTAVNLGNQSIIQDGQGPNSAIFVQNSQSNSTWKIGDSVLIKSARVRENFNVTTLYEVDAEVLASNAVIPEFEKGLSMTIFATNNVNQARQWEGVLVRWDSVFVVKTNADSVSPTSQNFGEFLVKDTLGSTNALLGRSVRVDDMSNALFNINRTFSYGSFLPYVQGPMNFTFSNFKLTPRNLNDIGMCSMDTIKPTIIASPTDSVFVGSGAYTHPNVTASDNKDGNLTPYVVTTGTVNTAAIGTYNVTYTVSDFCGNTTSVNRTVIVKDTPNTGLERNDIVAANISVYPNPAKDVITISATDVKTLPLNVAVYDMIGREMLTRTYNDKNVNETININNLNNGVYFLVMKNAQGTHSVKFVVTGK